MDSKVKIVVIQLGDQQIDALMEYQETRSISLAVYIVDSILDDLGIGNKER